MDVALSIFSARWCTLVVCPCPLCSGCFPHFVCSPLLVCLIQKPLGPEQVSGLVITWGLGSFWGELVSGCPEAAWRWPAGAKTFFLSTTSVVHLCLSSMTVPGFGFAQGSENSGHLPVFPHHMCLELGAAHSPVDGGWVLWLWKFRRRKP